MAYPKSELSPEEISVDFHEFVFWDTQRTAQEGCKHIHLQIDVKCPRCHTVRTVRVSQLRYLNRVPYCSNCARRRYTKPEHIREDWHQYIDFSSQQPKDGETGPTVIAVTCPECGEERWVRSISLTRSSSKASADRLPWCRRCGMEKGKERTLKRGDGKRISAHGYVYVFTATLSPKDRAMVESMLVTSGRRSVILEHRLVMARHLGRPLLQEEQVHHKNGDRADNRLANLRLVTSGSHPVAPKDKIALMSVEIESVARELQTACIDPTGRLEKYLAELRSLLPKKMFENETR